MPKSRRTWQEELEIIDRTMKAISGVTDPEELVNVYWRGIGDLVPVDDYISMSRRDVEPPWYLITRSSRFTEDINPWLQRDRLPKFSGGLLGEIVYANRPVIMEDIPARLSADDPAREYLAGFQSLVALPQYDEGEGLNVTVMLLPAGVEIDHSMVPMLHWQAGLFGRGTTNLVLRNRLSKALAALDKELQTVGEIQRSLLPQELPRIGGFELAAHYLTSARAGGDYYDFFPLSDGRWGLFIADVSGHGTPAAVLMAITHALAHSQPGTRTPPDELLRYLNQQLAQFYTHDGTFVTAFYGVLEPQRRKITYSMAGHNPPRLARDGRILSLDKNAALPLGIIPEQRYGLATLSIEPGDLLLLYTDGITEAPAPLRGTGPRELFGIERLDPLLIDCGTTSAQACVARILKEVERFTCGAPARDDQTLIAIRCQ
jgi:sigma-B regulation protein RsbU (phosphoserine phosphatase)